MGRWFGNIIRLWIMEVFKLMSSILAHNLTWWLEMMIRDEQKCYSTNFLHLILTCKQKIDICEKMPATIGGVQAGQISIRYSKDWRTDWPWKGLEMANVANARMCEIQINKSKSGQSSGTEEENNQTIGFSRCLTLTWPWWGQDVLSEQQTQIISRYWSC